MYRVIWQFDKKRMGPITSENIPRSPLPSSLHDPLFTDIAMIGKPEPVFRRPPLALRSAMVAMLDAFKDDPVNDLAGYQHVFVKEYDAALLLKKRLSNETDIQYVDIQGRPKQPLIIDKNRRKRLSIRDAQFGRMSLHPSPTPNYESLQEYLNPAPDGIDAKFTWNLPGGPGDGVTIIDIESGWNFDHEDLLEQHIGVIAGINKNSDHGTAVLGIYSGDNNDYGIKGIVPNALAGAIVDSFFIPPVNYHDKTPKEPVFEGQSSFGLLK